MFGQFISRSGVCHGVSLKGGGPKRKGLNPGSCEAPEAPKPPGFHTTAREPKRAHFRAPAFKHHQNSTRRHPERQKKSEMVAGERKKSEILGGPAEGWSGGVQTHNHTNTNTNTARNEGWKPE